MNNIILSGTMRSGTTLISSMLNAHPNIDLVSDTLTWYFKRCYKQYGPMHNEYELNNALYEMEPFMKHHHNKYTLDELRNAVIKKGISYEALYEALIELELGKKIVAHYGIKTTHLAYRYEHIIESMPNTKIIHMVRDVKDVYYSHKNFLSKKRFLSKLKATFKSKICQKVLNKKIVLDERTFNPYHFNQPKHMIDYWASSNQLALDLKIQYPSNILIMKYEDLIKNVDENMEMVMNFLGIPFSSDFYQYDNLKDRNNQKWKDNSSFKSKSESGYDQSKIGRGKSKLSPKELEYITEKCQKLLEDLRYEV